VPFKEIPWAFVWKERRISNERRIFFFIIRLIVC
jgi:hypothetical protein